MPSQFCIFLPPSNPTNMPLKQTSSRLEGFSDSVFAFAATLLVVTLEVPDSIDQLRNMLVGFISFGISFGGLVYLWYVHNQYFRRISGIDNGIIVLNMLLLFVILFYVYPLKFLANTMIGENILGSAEDFALVLELYGLGFICIFAIVTAMYAYAARLGSAADNQEELRFYARHFAIFVFVGLLSTGLAYAQLGLRFGLSGFAYLLIGPLCYIHGVRYGVDD